MKRPLKPPSTMNSPIVSDCIFALRPVTLFDKALTSALKHMFDNLQLLVTDDSGRCFRTHRATSQSDYLPRFSVDQSAALLSDGLFANDIAALEMNAERMPAHTTRAIRRDPRRHACIEKRGVARFLYAHATHKAIQMTGSRR
jgi:hypothetical protein